jgi:hypothetical protein
MKTPVTLLPDHATLSARLTAALSANREPVEIVERRQARMMSTFPNEMVTCRLPRGGTIRVFIKYQGGQGHVAYGHRGNVAYEAEVYLSGLRPLADFRPRCLGTHRDGQTGETWLMMEYLDRCIRVSDLSLREERLVPTMLQGTRWMGRFHALNEARAGSGELKFLARYDADYYRGWARRTYQLAGPLLPRFPWLQELCERCDDWIAPLLAAPQTFIHGELYSKHLLLRRHRVYCIDWESAALAPGEIDLATLTEGKGWPPELVRGWESEYRRARWSEGPPAAFERTLDAARMYLHFRWLGERPEWTLADKYLWRYEHLHAAARRLGLIEGPPVAQAAGSGEAL